MASQILSAVAAGAHWFKTPQSYYWAQGLQSPGPCFGAQSHLQPQLCQAEDIFFDKLFRSRHSAVPSFPWHMNEVNCFGELLLQAHMDVAEQLEAKPSQFPSGTPNSKKAKIDESKVSQEGQLCGSEAAAKQEEAEMRGAAHRGIQQSWLEPFYS